MVVQIIASAGRTAEVSSTPSVTGVAGIGGVVQSVPEVPTDIGLLSTSTTTLTTISAEPDLSTGSLGLEVPFALPTARAHFGPALSLQYHSAAGNGPLGVGWLLSLSTITRSVEHDTEFFLEEGHAHQRLVETDSTRKEFRVETRPLADRFFFETGVDGVEYWHQIRNDGRRLIYRRVDGAHTNNSSKLHSWHLSTVEDGRGNTIEYRYLVDNGAVYLWAVAYSPIDRELTFVPSNPCASLRRYATCVAFLWTERVDVETSFATGTKTQIGLRLTDIDVYSFARRVWGYSLAYDANQEMPNEQRSAVTGRSLLSHIDLVGVEHGHRRIATFGYNASSGYAWKFLPWAADGRSPDSQHSTLGDFNGDGLADFASVFNEQEAAYEMGMTVFDSATGRYSTKAEKVVPGPVTRICHETKSGGRVQSKECVPLAWHSVVGDFRAQGRTAIAYSVPFFQWSMFFFNGTTVESPVWLGPVISPLGVVLGFRGLTHACRVGDFSGDRIVDLVCNVNARGVWGLGRSGGKQWTVEVIKTGPRPLAAQEMNAFSPEYFRWLQTCAAADVLLRAGQELVCPSAEDPQVFQGVYWGEGTEVSHEWRLPVPREWVNSGCVVGDFNGDRLSDLACRSGGASGEWRILPASGTGWLEPGTPSVGPSSVTVHSDCRPIDVSGDGRQDVVCRVKGSGKFDFALSEGTHFAPWASIDVPAIAKQPILPDSCFVADFTGDGAGDILCDTTVPGRRGLFTSAIPFPDSLTSVVGELGEVTTFGYSAGATQPDHQIPFGQKIVIRQRRLIAGAPPLDVDIAYSGGRYDVEHERVLGFAYARKTLPGDNGSDEEVWFHAGRHESTQETASESPSVCPTLIGRITKTIRTDHETKRRRAVFVDYTSVGTHNHSHEISRVRTTEPECKESSECEPTPELLRTSFYYDEFGNVLAQTQWAFGELRTLALLNEYRPASPRWPGTFVTTASHAFSICEVASSADCPTSPSDVRLWRDLIAAGGASLSQLNTGVRPGALLRRSKYTYRPHTTGSGVPELINVDRAVDRVSNSLRDTFGYDDYGNLVSHAMPTGGSLRVDYDRDRIRLVEVVPPSGHTARYDYYSGPASRGLFEGVLEAVRLDGIPHTTFMYDEYGRVTTASTPEGDGLQYQYGPASNLSLPYLRMTHSSVGWSEVYVDQAGRIVKRRALAPGGQITTIAVAFDAIGRKRQLVGPLFENELLGPVTRFDYDAFDRPVRLSRADGSAESYCYGFNTVGRKDANNHVTAAWLSGRSLLLKTAEFVGEFPTCELPSHPPEAVTTFTRNAMGDLIRIEGSLGRSVALTRDLLSRVTMVADAGITPVTFRYSAFDSPDEVGYGRMTLRSNRDKVGRITALYSSLYQRGTKPVVSYNYSIAADTSQRSTVVAGPEGTTTYSFDFRGRLTTVQQIGRAGLLATTRDTFRFERDRAGRVSSLEYPDKWKAVFRYDAGLAYAIETPEGSLFRHTEFDASGRPTVTVLDGALVQMSRYDLLGRLAETTILRGHRSLLNRCYTYDAEGNILKIAQSDGFRVDAVYDGLDRLIKAGIAGRDLQYEYDASGNVTFSSPAGSYEYAPSKSHPNAVVRTDVGRIEYDVDGKASKSLHKGFRYDYLGWPKRVVGEGQRIDLNYLPSGEIRGVSRGIERRYRFGDMFECVGVKCVRRLSAGLSTAEISADGGWRRYVFADQLGTPILATDRVGATSVGPLFDPFGEPRTKETRRLLRDSARGFAGATVLTPDLYSVGARLFDSRIARFLAVDPVLGGASQPQSLNAYSYAMNNPYRYRDPSGEQASQFNGEFAGRLHFRFEIGTRLDVARLNAGITLDLQALNLSLQFQHAGVFAQLGLLAAEFASLSNSLGVLAPGVGSFSGNPTLPGAGLPFSSNVNQIAINAVNVLLYTAGNPGGNENRFLGAFRDLVQSGGIYDLKKFAGPAGTLHALQQQNLGNFNYGVVAASYGLPLEIALFGAGAASYQAHHKEPEYARLHAQGFYGTLNEFPYGDDPVDSYWIMLGYEFFQTDAATLRVMAIRPGGIGIPLGGTR